MKMDKNIDKTSKYIKMLQILMYIVVRVKETTFEHYSGKVLFNGRKSCMFIVAVYPLWL